MLTIILDTVTKRRNAQEYRTPQRATFGTYSKVGDGAIIHLLCKDMFDAGEDPAEIVEVYRGNTNCFEPQTLQNWAYPPKKRAEK